MTITVRDALHFGGLIEAKVIAGASGLDNEIWAVDIIDVPDAAIWFRRHLLLSSAFYALKDYILPAELALLGVKKPLLVTDQGVVKAGLLDQVTKPLKDASVGYVLYDQVVFKPPLATVAAGTEMYQKNGCDGLIALGGGSSMDCAKAIGVEIAHGEPVLEYECAEDKKN